MTLAMARGTSPVTRMLCAHTGAQFKIFSREPISLLSLALPIILYTFFGMQGAEAPYAPGVTVGAYMLASLGAYGVSSVMVFNFGLVIATERGANADALLRASPLPGWVYLTAKTITAIVFGMFVLGVLFLFASTLGGLRLPSSIWMNMALGLLLGSVPFIALGFALGYGLSPQAAPAAANLLFLVLAFASGMFVPLRQMPELIREVAPFLPTYHYAQLSWNAVGMSSGSLGASIAWLVAYGVALFVAAAWAYRRARQEEVRR